MARPETFDDLTPADKVGDLIVTIPNYWDEFIPLKIPTEILVPFFQLRIAIRDAVERGDLLVNGNSIYMPLSEEGKQGALELAKKMWDGNQKRLAAVLGEGKGMKLYSWMRSSISHHACIEGYDMDVVEKALDAYQWAE